MELPELQFAWIGAAISAVGGLLTSLFNNKTAQENTKENAEHQYEIWQREFGQQNDRQDYLNTNAQSIYSNSMRQAGYSPLWTGSGGVASTSVSSPSVSAGNAGRGALEGFDASQLGSIYKQMQEARLIKAEAKAKERENKQNENYDNLLKQLNFSRDMWERLFGEKWYADMANAAMNGDNDADGALVLPMNEGNLRAYKQAIGLNTFNSNQDTQISSNEALQSLNDYNKSLNDYKREHPDIIKADAHMTEEQYKNLVQIVNNAKKQGILLDDEHGIKVNTAKLQDIDIKDAEYNKISALFDTIFNKKDASVFDKFLAVIGFAFNKFFHR